jgi:hypothetical protein
MVVESLFTDELLEQFAPFFRDLGLEPGAPLEDTKRAYEKAMLKYQKEQREAQEAGAYVTGKFFSLCSSLCSCILSVICKSISSLTYLQCICGNQTRVCCIH